MARRRYLSTEISVDKQVNKLLSRYGPEAALLYTWMIPHTEDDRSITADPEEILLTVIPGNRKLTVEKVQIFLNAMVDLNLLTMHNGRLFFPAESFYKYQSYIPENKRNYDEPAKPTPTTTPQNAEEHRKTPQNTASPSPSLSLSLINNKYTCANSFIEFWQAYPKKRSKGDAEKAWNKIQPDEQLHNRIMQSLERAKTSADWTKENGQFIPYPATWLNAKGWEDEYKEAHTNERQLSDKGGKRRLNHTDNRDWEKLLGID